MVKSLWLAVLIFLGCNTVASAQCNTTNFSKQLFTNQELTDIATVAASIPNETEFVRRGNAFSVALNALFGRVSGRISTKLNAASPLYAGINTEGLALIFASTLAFELIDNCSILSDVNSLSAIDVIKNRTRSGLACQGYASLTLQFFYLMFPDSNAKIVKFGTLREASIDNHSTISAFGMGVDLFVDPTTSIVAPISLWGMLTHQIIPTNSIVQFSERNPDRVGPKPVGAGYRPEFYDMLLSSGTGGNASMKLDHRTLAYAFPSKTNPNNPGTPNRFLDITPTNRTYQGGDLISSSAFSNIGGAPAIWYLTGTAGNVWSMWSSGMLNTGYQASLITSANNGVYISTLNSNMLLGYVSGTAGFNYVTYNGVALKATSMAPGVNGSYLWFVDAGTKLWFTSGAVANVGNTGGTKTVLGTGDTIQQLGVNGNLYQATATQGFTLVDSNVKDIWLARPTTWDFAPANPNCVTQSDPWCRGDLVKLNSWSAPYGNLHYRDGSKGTPSWAFIHGGVATVVLGTEGATVNYLTGSGKICNFSSGVNWSASVTNGGNNNEAIPPGDWTALYATSPSTPTAAWANLSYGTVPELAGYGRNIIQATDINSKIYFKLSTRWIDKAENNRPCP